MYDFVKQSLTWTGYVTKASKRQENRWVCQRWRWSEACSCCSREKARLLGLGNPISVWRRRLGDCTPPSPDCWSGSTLTSATR